MEAEVDPRDHLPEIELRLQHSVARRLVLHLQKMEALALLVAFVWQSLWSASLEASCVIAACQRFVCCKKMLSEVNLRSSRIIKIPAPPKF